MYKKDSRQGSLLRNVGVSLIYRYFGLDKANRIRACLYTSVKNDAAYAQSIFQLLGIEVNDLDHSWEKVSKRYHHPLDTKPKGSGVNQSLML